MRILPLVLCGALVLGLGSRASAQPAGEPAAELATMRERATAARFDEAVTPAPRFLARHDVTAAQRNVALEVLASAQIAEHMPGAQDTLDLLYRRDPDHRLADPDV